MEPEAASLWRRVSFIYSIKFKSSQVVKIEMQTFKTVHHNSFVEVLHIILDRYDKIQTVEVHFAVNLIKCLTHSTWGGGQLLELRQCVSH